SWRQLFESAGAGDGLGVTIATRGKSGSNGNGSNGASNGSLVAATGATPLVPPPYFDEPALKTVLPFTAPDSTAGLSPEEARFGRTFGLVNAHRARGHMIA